MSKRKFLFGTVFLGLGLFCVGAFAHVTAQSVTQGYESDQALQKGMVVRLKPNDGTKIQASTQQDEKDILGVVVTAADASISLSNTDAAQETFVANSGRHDVLVSTQNGVIKTGDYIMLSALAGVGMKADGSREIVVGKALKDFDGTSSSEGSAVLKTSSGGKNVSLGRVSVDVSVGRSPLYSKDDPAGVPDFLKKMARVVTDQPVTAFRMYAAAMLLLITLIVVGVILFAGVRTGMVAVGRNPLAKSTVYRSLIQVTLMSLIIFVIGAIAVYLLLRV